MRSPHPAINCKLQWDTQAFTECYDSYRCLDAEKTRGPWHRDGQYFLKEEGRQSKTTPNQQLLTGHFYQVKGVLIYSRGGNDIFIFLHHGGSGTKPCVSFLFSTSYPTTREDKAAKGRVTGTETKELTRVYVRALLFLYFTTLSKFLDLFLVPFSHL